MHACMMVTVDCINPQAGTSDYPELLDNLTLIIIPMQYVKRLHSLLCVHAIIMLAIFPCDGAFILIQSSAVILLPTTKPGGLKCGKHYMILNPKSIAPFFQLCPRHSCVYNMLWMFHLYKSH